MGSWLFGGKSNVNKPAQPASSLRFQTSIEGKPLAIIWGENRIAGNLIWYGSFEAVPIQNAGSGGGGKGGGAGGGSGKGGGQGSVTYNYRTAVAIALCEGPITEVQTAFANKSAHRASTLGFTTFVGDYAQSAWGYLTTNFPDEALTYRGVAYLANEALDLGQATDLPNFSFDVTGAIANALHHYPDANPKDVWNDFLTNENYGVGFPSARLDMTLTQWSNACIALGIVVSPALVEQREASGFMADLLMATNASARWSNGILTVVPWYDTEVSDNGVTYVPDVAPLYDITEDDLLPNQGSAGGGAGTGSSPIIIVRKRRSDMINSVQLEYLSRSADYDPVVIDAKDQASIDVYGLRTSDVRSFHMFCEAGPATLSAALQLNREQVPNTYVFTLGPKFILPDVEDILTLTRYQMGLYRQPVRIVDIQENADGSLTFTTEDYLGTASAPVYGTQASSGATTNTNEDPGAINPPIIFEPTAAAIGFTGLEIWGAVSGEDLTKWGGANVYASTDGVNYTLQPNVVRGPARMGVLTAALDPVTAATVGQTIDQTHTLAVDLSESGGDLLSGSTADAVALTTLCYVDGELLAYATATLTSSNHYDLTYLVRGVYDTEAAIVTHPIGSAFARLDSGVIRIPFDQIQIGQTIYLKFQSYNRYGGGLEELSSLTAYPYIIQGTALKSPLPDVSNLRVAYADERTQIFWDEVSDFRNPDYEIRLGDTWDAGVSLGTQAHPPFAVPGNGTFWIAAHAIPAPGVVVYSEAPQSITIGGAIIQGYALIERDLAAVGWPGTFTGGAGIDIELNAIRTGGSGDITAVVDFTAVTDVVNYGIEQDGSYEIASSQWIDAGYDTVLNLTVQYKAQSSTVDSNILALTDYLNTPDILGAGGTDLIGVEIQVSIAQDGAYDIYAPVDIFAEPDIFTAGAVWSDFQKFSPGKYPGRLAKFRVDMSTLDQANIIAYVTQFKLACRIPARIDTLTNQTISDAGTAIVFTPNGSSFERPFNGGSNGAAAPTWSWSITDAEPGDNVSVTDLTLSGCTVTVYNAGVAVTRSGVNLAFEGY